MNGKTKLWSIYLAIPFVIAIISCFIVDYAIAQQFTWSVIVASSCIFAYLILFMLLFGGKFRILLAYAVICILIIPYLYIIEKITNFLSLTPVYWVTELAIPISIIWLVACGVIILIWKITHINAWTLCGLIVLTWYIAEKFNNSILDTFLSNNNYSNDSWYFSDHYPIVYFGLAAILLLIGIFFTIIKHIKKQSIIKD